MKVEDARASVTVARRLVHAGSGCFLALAAVAATLAAAGIYELIFLALESGGLSVDMALRLAPRMLCAVLGACSA